MEEVKKSMSKAGEAISQTAQNIGAKAKEAIDTTKARLTGSDENKAAMSDAQGLTSQAHSGESCEELKGNDPFKNSDALHAKMIKEFKEFIDCEDETKCQRLFLSAERAYASATACEHEVVYPCLRELARTCKIDKSYRITTEMLLADHMLFDQILCSLRRHSRDTEVICTPGFREAVQGLVDYLEVHHKRTCALLNDAQKFFTDSEMARMCVRMRDVYTEIPRDPFGSCSQQQQGEVSAPARK